MALFRRRRTLPAEHRPALDRDERVVAWALSPQGALVATTRGLWLPGSPQPGLGARLGWHEIHKAGWDGTTLRITPARRVEEGPGYEVVADRPSVGFRLDDPGDLPAQVRARVTKSVGPSSHHPLPGSGGVRVVGRRVPGLDGLTWTARYDDGVDHDDPIVRETTAALVEQARAAVPE
jgi:hypothetical protein